MLGLPEEQVRRWGGWGGCRGDGAMEVLASIKRRWMDLPSSVKLLMLYFQAVMDFHFFFPLQNKTPPFLLGI